MLHDQGEEFENGLFRQLTNLLEVNNLCTTPYHLKTNGLTECMHQKCGLFCVFYQKNINYPEKPILFKS